jgi:cytochrome c oxidase subunit 3
MSTASTIPATHDAHGHGPGDGHDPHLAHHFDTPEQQFASGKLGMWVFLATEILMFGGLFCAYSVYRHNHPDVFEYAHQYLDKSLGAINTIVLITSSLTMAWGVRLAQLGKMRGLYICLILTILGGYIFMGIKSIEYKTKWHHQLGLATANKYRPGGVGMPATGAPEGHEAGGHEGATSAPATTQAAATGAHESHATHETHETAAPIKPRENPDYFDPNIYIKGEAANIRPVAMPPPGLAPKVVEEHQKHVSEEELEGEYTKLPTDLDKERTYTFFQVYFLMTGLHGLHVVVGMALIFWILVKAVPKRARGPVMWLGLASIGVFFLYVGILVHNGPSNWIGIILLAAAVAGLLMAMKGPRPAVAGAPGEFGPEYFTPVDIVGLYWHLVDLIWIFLFPLLYLIH